ncbi:MAG: hypothetical protein ACJ796_05430 [Gemmatimonadaceae bacterium]
MRSRLSIFLLLTVTSVTLAQGDSLTRHTGALCWRGQRAPACHQFWITEISVEYPFATTTTNHTTTEGPNIYRYSQHDISPQLLWTVGPMFNTGPDRALGVTVSAGFVSGGGRAAVEVRRRYWTSEQSSFDLSTGLVRMSVPNPGHFSQGGYGLTAGAYAVGGDMIHVNTRADMVFSGNRLRAGGSIGLGVGSYPALGVTAALGVLTAIVIAAVARNGDF